MKLSVLAAAAVLLATSNANPMVKRQSTTAVVNLSNNTGAINHLASGTLYGLPDTQGQVPASFYTNMAWNYERAGGAQIPAPGRGWIWGINEYKVSQIGLDYSRMT